MNDFCNLISRNKLHICLRSGFWETDSAMKFYWGVLLETPPGREWRQQAWAEGGSVLSYSFNRTSADSCELLTSWVPLRRSHSRISADISSQGPVVTGGKLGWGCSFLRKVGHRKEFSWESSGLTFSAAGSTRASVVERSGWRTTLATTASCKTMPALPDS